MNTTPNRFIVSEPAQLVNFPAVVRPQPDRRRGDVADDADSLELPAIDSAMDLVADPTVQLPAELVEGVLHRGLKGVIGANSKARKTWILLDLALSVATGTKWWNWNTSGGRVLFVNFEIPKAFLKQRIQTLARRKQLTNYQNLAIWTLRGCSSNFTKLVEAMKGLSWVSPRGPMSIDPETRDITQNVYVREVKKVDGQLYNVEFATIANVKGSSK